MSRYYDSQRCPDCRASLSAEATACGSCGLPLRGLTAERLAAALRQADVMLARLRDERTAAAVEADPPAVTAPTPPGVASTARAGGWLSGASVAAILLGLGALCTLVAATVFVAVTWGDLSVAARTAMLLGVTVLFAAAAVAVTHRGLRGSAEALWLVVAGMFALDLAGARTAGLLGADTVRLATWLTASGIALLLFFAAVARLAQATPIRALIGAQVAAALGLVAAAIGRAVVWPYDIGWFAALAVAVVAGIVAVSGALRLHVLAMAAAGLAALSWAILGLSGVESAVTAPALGQLVGQGTGGQLLVAAGYAAAAACLRALPQLICVVAAGLSLAGAGLLVWLPTWAEGRTPAALGIAVVAVLLATAALAAGTSRVWAPAAAAVALVAWTAVAVVVGALLGAAADSAVRTASQAWAAGPSAAVAAPHLAGLPRAWTLPLLLAAAGLVATVLTGWLLRIRRTDPAEPAVAPNPAAGLGVALVTGVAGIAVLPLLYAGPLWLAVVVPAVVGAVALAAAEIWTRSVTAPRGGLLALTGLGWALPLVVAGVPALASTSLTAALASGVAALAAVGALTGRRSDRHRSLLALLAVTAAGVAVFGWARLMDVPPAPRAFVLTVMAVLALLAAQAGPVRRIVEARRGAEAGAGVVAIAGLLLLASHESLGWLALALTLVGAGVVAVALLVGDRRQVAGPGGVLLAGASWVRLVDTGVDVVEAYTLPSAVVLLAVGLRRLQRDASVGTARALLPGLTLGVVPSLLASLTDPVSLRGLLLGIACVALVLAGVALRWSTPLVVGASALAILAVRELGPLALAVPRWSLLGAAGLLLIAVGVTWEQRWRDVVSAARYVASMR